MYVNLNSKSDTDVFGGLCNFPSFVDKHWHTGGSNQKHIRARSCLTLAQSSTHTVIGPDNTTCQNLLAVSISPRAMKERLEEAGKGATERERERLIEAKGPWCNEWWKANLHNQNTTGQNTTKTPPTKTPPPDHPEHTTSKTPPEHNSNTTTKT